MASGPLVGGGGGGDGSREKQRWAESKVYTRKAYKKPQSQQKPPVSSQQTLATTTDDINSSLQQPPSPQQKQQQPPLFSRFDSAPSDDDASSLNNRGHHQHADASDPVPPNNHSNHYHHSGSNHNNGHRTLSSQKLENSDSHIVISLSSRSKHEFREIRSKLEEELDQVRATIKKVEARELELVSSSGHAPVATGYSHSQLSASDTHHMVATKRPATNYEAASAAPLRRQLSVSVATLQAENSNMNDSMEKEKRTPKANQYYRNSEFVLGKEKFPPPDSQKKSKANGSKKHLMAETDYGMPLLDKMYAQAFKSCGALLTKLMKHKHGWVFNTPVDVKGLGLHDYYTIIKHPMDLGTVKSRLNKNKYRSPLEFAEDVRLTFRNAMTYNPKGQDVHVMAEQLFNLFEDQWPAIEAEYNALSYSAVTKRAPPPLDMRRVLERSESTTHPMVPDSKPKAVSYTPHVGRTPAPKKPKAKDPYKRDMTFEEKQKLSYNLQSLPSEKLDNIVQIIKKRNSSLSQHDDEIEVDIESVDTETLWELDRFVTNYKKSLSKNKRKAELAVLARQEAAHNVQERNSQNPVPAAVELPKESKTVEDEKHVASSSPGERKGDNASRSSSSNSSSSDSGSSSSDSDSGSSSAYGSDVGHSPRT